MSDSDGDSVRSAHGSPAHSPGYSPSSPDYGPNGNGEYGEDNLPGPSYNRGWVKKSVQTFLSLEAIT